MKIKKSDGISVGIGFCIYKILMAYNLFCNLMCFFIITFYSKSKIIHFLPQTTVLLYQEINKQEEDVIYVRGSGV